MRAICCRTSLLGLFNSFKTTTKHASSLNSLRILQKSSIADRSFRLANISDLSVAAAYNDKVKSEHYFHHTSELFPRDTSRQLLIDLSHEQGYRRGHIPGALNLSLESFDFTRLVDVYDGISQDEIVQVMTDLGVDDNASEIILYDNSGLLACRLWFVLRYFGFTNVRVLNGGWRAWLKAGLPVEENVVPPRKGGQLRLKPKRSNLITKPTQMVFDHEQQKQTSYYIDTRRPEAYKVYHIPRAVNVPVTLFMQDGVFSAVKEIRRVLTSKGVDVEEGRYITYSSQRLSATVGYFALTMAGLDHVSVYDGGIYNWVANFENKLSPEAIEHLGR